MTFVNTLSVVSCCLVAILLILGNENADTSTHNSCTIMHLYKPAVEPAWHRRRQQQRSAARKLLKAVEALIAASAEVPSHLVTEIPKAIAHIQGHHGSEVPRRVLDWVQSMKEGWQTKSYGKKRRSWLWTPQSAEKYGWVACIRRMQGMAQLGFIYQRPMCLWPSMGL